MEKRFVSISILKYVPYPLEILFIVSLSSYFLKYALTLFALFVLFVLFIPFFDFRTKYSSRSEQDQWSFLGQEKGSQMHVKSNHQIKTIANLI